MTKKKIFVHLIRYSGYGLSQQGGNGQQQTYNLNMMFSLYNANLVRASSVSTTTLQGGFGGNYTQYMTSSQWSATLTGSDWNSGNAGLGIQATSLSSSTGPTNAFFACSGSQSPCNDVQMTIHYYFDVFVTGISPNAYYGTSAAGGIEIQIYLTVLSQVTTASAVQCQIGGVQGTVNGISYNTQPPYILCTVPSQTVRFIFFIFFHYSHIFFLCNEIRVLDHIK